MKSFQDECNFSAEAIPQQAVISRFLMSRTGFTLRPVAGLLSARNFLNGKTMFTETIIIRIIIIYIPFYCFSTIFRSCLPRISRNPVHPPPL